MISNSLFPALVMDESRPITKGMAFNYQSLAIIVVLLCSFCSICDATSLSVWSDQPAILDSNITFYAQLTSPSQDEYTLSWQENFFPRYGVEMKLNKTNNYTAHLARSYDSTVSPGGYSLTCSVFYYQLWFRVPVATEVVSFNLTRNFPGKLVALQPGVRRKDDSLISTRNETVLTVDLHDPSNYIKNAVNVSYSWFINGTLAGNTSVPQLKHNFTEEGFYNVNASMVAFFKNKNTEDKKGNATFTKKYGAFKTSLSAVVPIVNFTIHGDTWFPHEKLLDLKITCDGTPPYSYCVMFKQPKYNVTGNETCSSESPAVTNDCEIPFSWYFSSPGTHTLLIILDNDISHFVNRTMINVYKVAKKQPLSIIVVPITCSLIALVLIIFGVAYFKENQAKLNVEVADFDFGQNNELPYVTFMDRLRDALSPNRASRQRLFTPIEEPGVSQGILT